MYSNYMHICIAHVAIFGCIPADFSITTQHYEMITGRNTYYFWHVCITMTYLHRTGI